jgi:hypothetical protein
MAKLEAHHKETCKAKLVPLQRDLYHLEMLPTESVTSYADRAQDMFEQYITAGGKMSDSELTQVYQAGLPDVYDSVISAMSISGKTFTLHEIVNHLLPIELKVNKAAECVRNPAYGSYHKPFRGTCNNCGKSGHKERNCRERNSGSKPPFCVYCKKTGHLKHECLKLQRAEEQHGDSVGPNFQVLAL